MIVEGCPVVLGVEIADLGESDSDGDLSLSCCQAASGSFSGWRGW